MSVLQAFGCRGLIRVFGEGDEAVGALDPVDLDFEDGEIAVSNSERQLDEAV